MSFPKPVEPLLTERDHARLTRLNTALPEPLLQLLDQAELVRSEAVPADVVTMYTRVLAHDEGEASPQTLTLCYPADAEPSLGFISVLSPVGTALLGRRRGEAVHWRTPTGATRQLHIDELLFQPEASGDYLI